MDRQHGLDLPSADARGVRLRMDDGWCDRRARFRRARHRSGGDDATGRGGHPRRHLRALRVRVRGRGRALGPADARRVGGLADALPAPAAAGDRDARDDAQEQRSSMGQADRASPQAGSHERHARSGLRRDGALKGRVARDIRYPELFHLVQERGGRQAERLIGRFDLLTIGQLLMSLVCVRR